MSESFSLNEQLNVVYSHRIPVWDGDYELLTDQSVPAERCLLPGQSGRLLSVSERLRRDILRVTKWSVPFICFVLTNKWTFYVTVWIMVCLHLTSSFASTSTFLSTLTLCLWWCKHWYREWIWTLSLCVHLHHHSLNTKLDASVDVDANADVKIKQGFTCLWATDHVQPLSGPSCCRQFKGQWKWWRIPILSILFIIYFHFLFSVTKYLAHQLTVCSL